MLLADSDGVRLTHQQAHILQEFRPASDPHEQTSETLSICGVREWPTCDNLIALGLLDRVEWLGNDEGWLYRLTPAGRVELAKRTDAPVAACDPAPDAESPGSEVESDA